MAVYSTRYSADWKLVKGNFTKSKQLCSRCNNEVSYQLVWDGDGIGMPGIWTLKYKKYYAFKCPICPQFEPVSAETVKAVMKDSL